MILYPSRKPVFGPYPANLSRAVTDVIFSPNEFKFGKMSSSIESDRGSIVNALATIERQDELVSCALRIWKDW